MPSTLFAIFLAKTSQRTVNKNGLTPELWLEANCHVEEVCGILSAFDRPPIFLVHVFYKADIRFKAPSLPN